MSGKNHITTLITLLDNVPHPKTDGVRSGYAPHHKFAAVGYLASGFQTYPDDSIHYPGETLIASIAFPSWEFFGSSVRVGDVFEIRELDRVVGHGVIQSIDP